MKRIIEIFKNIYRIEDLRSRIVYTLFILVIYRLGSNIVLPGVNPNMLAALAGRTQDGLLGVLDMFSGGAFSSASVFALGIMPYISASIVIQLLGIAVPYFQRLQREGESGRRKMNQITRYLTLVILFAQAPAYLSQIPLEAKVNPGMYFNISSIIILATGTMFVMWLGERITDKGIGNGISLIIMVGIIARMPFAFAGEFMARVSSQGGGLVMLIVELFFLFLVFVVTILLVQGTRKIPVQYAKRIVGNKQYGGVRQYIPIKVNAAGVMPIIFAQAIMFLPLTFIRMGEGQEIPGWIASLTNFTGFWYNFVFSLMVIAFTYFYTAITISPQRLADEIKKNGGFIPGVKPGKKTVDYFDNILSKITLPGSMFLAFVAILPAFAVLAGINMSAAQFYGGTSLLILVGVIMDTLQQIESHLLMRHYDGLMKSGKVKGRAGSAASM